MARLLITLALALQPTWFRADLEREWIAELDAVERAGQSQVGFALRLLRSAPATAIELRAETNLAFAEFSIALMLGTFSSVMFAVSAVMVDKPDMALWQGITAAGSFVLAVGLWRDEGGFFGSKFSKTGAALVMVGRGALSTYPIHIPVQEELVARDDIALSAVAFGILVTGIAQLPRFKSQLGVRVGLTIAAAASLVGGASDVINILWLSEPWPVNVALGIAAVTSTAIAVTLYMVLRRDEVFRDLPA